MTRKIVKRSTFLHPHTKLRCKFYITWRKKIFQIHKRKEIKELEMLGIEPRASYMQSMRSTTELHPPLISYSTINIAIEKDKRYLHSKVDCFLNFAFKQVNSRLFVQFYFSSFNRYRSLYSSVAEHWSCKPGVLSSILSGGIAFFIYKICSFSRSWSYFDNILNFWLKHTFIRTLS